MQINLYALLIERNTNELAKKFSIADPGAVAGAQVVYLPGKLPIRCEVRLDHDAALAFLKQRMTDLLAEDLPPTVSDVDELWQCDYCPVRSTCEHLHGGPVGKAANSKKEE
jgi:hypothetical protein